MRILENLLYTNDHEWIRVEGNEAYIGITDYAQHALGDIVFVELPEVDAQFNAGDAFGVIESVKAAADIYIPVSARIIEVNEEISDDPSLVNKDAFENWMIKVELLDKSELDNLMTAKDYEEHCSKEE
ncbi:glycine cleavage system protein H [Fervidicella metallireducens AeB]|uniref:Glycine cleavage system H protein n=1 Tax=Fervidicella metallireducens AeB TaxID=1403537 RepID=A0A017RWH3_9CLOT|nr:glycine cleavage system protein GcvH [Fervidicella metallireducens]EYE88754.1 glycine cleavage system protein H [Fervidicella metallireducens AeB]